MLTHHCISEGSIQHTSQTSCLFRRLVPALLHILRRRGHAIKHCLNKLLVIYQNITMILTGVVTSGCRQAVVSTSVFLFAFLDRPPLPSPFPAMEKEEKSRKIRPVGQIVGGSKTGTSPSIGEDSFWDTYCENRGPWADSTLFEQGLLLIGVWHLLWRSTAWLLHAKGHQVLGQ